ncbi:anthranilate synthase component I [Halobacteroides halobius DSM 5150]|uniref:Anthranilate synthase component 1 n=1 Tax=Halobacteroides halobius (strain ATCC 35273 / DSM 5150 / MD-1) TaxID=748449 RepID=L0K7Q8_HALHC|nr:anthranilate synthase component I [Halobacteroides halobius]AGB40384.1 anthranilate synthase component I [Halobacteroides halobius DSM 5150]
MYFPKQDDFIKQAEEGKLIPVYKEVSGDMETPVSAFKKLKQGEYSYLLESVEQGQNLGRYSFIGLDYHALISCKDGVIRTKDRVGKIVSAEKTDNPLDDLKSLLKDYQGYQVDDLPMFYGGAVGYLGYDVIKYFEDIPQKTTDDLKLPEMLFVVSDTVLVFDHLHHNLKIVANVKVGKQPQVDYKKAQEKIDKIVAKLQQPLTEYSQQTNHTSQELEYTSNFTKEEFINSVQDAKDYITTGDIFQIVLSQRLEMPITTDSFAIYRQLRRLNPSPYMYYLNLGGFQLVGSSPELLVRVQDGRVENRPIAGTRRRGINSSEDESLAQDLLNDEKERAEHTMLVDLGRNDVGRVSKYGTVDVTELMEVEYYSHVMHLVSNVTGKLKEDEDIYSALEACFPAGTVSGAPKIRAMELIDQLEPTRRGPYAGSIGYFSYSGNLDSCITIRTILIQDDKAYVQAGAGIVADSDPETEYQETLNKAQGLLEAVQLAEGGDSDGISN